MGNKKIHSGKSNSGQKPLWLKVAFVFSYILLAFSFMTFLGQMGTTPFMFEFTVENSTDEVLIITPVGTAGRENGKYPLPIHDWNIFPMVSSKRGGYDLNPGEKITLFYDSDDINFSEIVAENSQGEFRQLVVMKNPEKNHYRVPSEHKFVIKNFDSLEPVPVHVKEAVGWAEQPCEVQFIFNCIMISPLVIYFCLLFLSKRYC